MIAATLLLCAHATVATKLRGEGSLAAPVPDSLSILAELHRDNAVASRADVIEGCRALNLALADMPHGAKP